MDLNFFVHVAMWRLLNVQIAQIMGTVLKNV